MNDEKNTISQGFEHWHQRVRSLLHEEIGAHLFAINFFCLLAFYEWLRWYFQWPHHPIIITLICAAGSIFCFWRIKGYKREMRQLDQEPK